MHSTHERHGTFIFQNQNEFTWHPLISLVRALLWRLIRPNKIIKRWNVSGPVISELTNGSTFPTFSASSRNAATACICISGARGCFRVSRRSTRLAYLFASNKKKERKENKKTQQTTKKKNVFLFVSSFFYSSLNCPRISEHDIYIFQTRSLSILFHQFHVVLLYREENPALF